MRPFEFLEPTDLSEAVSMLERHGGEAKLIAGGQSLLPLLKQRFLAPQYLISIQRLSELSYIKRTDGHLLIGAATTESAIEREPMVAEEFPILKDMESVLAAVQIRNWGTLGGSLAFSDPSGDPAPVLIGLGASVKLLSPRGERELPVQDLQTGYLETVLEDDEILTEIRIPRPAKNSGSAYATVAAKAGDLGIANAAAHVVLDSEHKVADARIVLGAQAVPPFRSKQAEKVAIGKTISDDLEDVAAAAAGDARPQADVLGSVEYKRELVGVLAKRALSVALSRAMDGGDPR